MMVICAEPQSDDMKCDSENIDSIPDDSDEPDLEVEFAKEGLWIDELWTYGHDENMCFFSGGGYFST